MVLKLNELDRLVLQTIVYSSCFNFALHIEEIYTRLPFSKKIIFSKQKINNSLKKLTNKGLIQSSNSYFYLDLKSLQNRQRKAKYISLKKREVEEFTSLVAKIPFIKAAVLTGSTAVDNAGQNDDLDFMIICQHNTLWFCRLLLIILTILKNKRPLSKANNAWCFNLWLDEADLSLEVKRQSIYEAYEILQMKFVYDRGKMQKTFLDANPWLKNYLFFYQQSNFGRYRPQRSYSVFNQLLFIMQKTYRRLVFGQENFNLSLTQAFFNELSFRKKVFAKLEKRMADILLS